MTDRLGIIIQARTGSKRFPNKVLKSLAGSPVIQHVIDACMQALDGRKPILAVPFEDVGKFTKFGVPVHYGPEDDVLERYYLAAKAYDLDIIVRITGDCPLIPPDIIRLVINEYHIGGASIVAIDHPRGGWPKGWGVEIFNWFTLNLAHTCAHSGYDREHVTPWMYDHCRGARLTNPEGNQSHLNYCVDYPKDIKRLEQIMTENKT